MTDPIPALDRVLRKPKVGRSNLDLNVALHAIPMGAALLPPAASS